MRRKKGNEKWNLGKILERSERDSITDLPQCLVNSDKENKLAYHRAKA